MSKAGFDEGTPVYVASGVFSRNDAVPASEYIAQVQYSPSAISLQLNSILMVARPKLTATATQQACAECKASKKLQPAFLPALYPLK